MSPSLATAHNRQIAIWILRIFSEDLAGFSLVKAGRYADPDIAQYLGLPIPLKKKAEAQLPTLMAEMLQELETAGDSALDETTAANFNRFAAAFQLNPVETAIQTLLALAHTESALADSFRVTRDQMAAKPARFMAHVLRLPQDEADAAMGKGSKLMTCGTIKYGFCRGCQHQVPQFFSIEVANKLAHEPYDPSCLLNAMGVKASEPPRLTMGDFPHLKAELSWLVEYLRMARREERPGVNILLYGDPGTGKTQLTRILGAEVGLPVFDFATHDNDGDPLDTAQRISTVGVAAKFFRDTPGLFVFDEFEDILAPSPNGRGTANERKGWFNHLLESNRHPVFWLSNSIHYLDAAFARRFDFVIEVPVPPRSCREHILSNELGKLVSKPVISRLAEVGSLAPAVISRVSSVIGGIESSFPENVRDEMAIRLIGSALKAQRRPMEQMPCGDILTPDVYDVSLLNVDANLDRMAAMLRIAPQARICLHGPPGTGKTALGHWLAREIDQPIHLKRASDMLSAFVGGTEQKIAEAFEQARSDGAILMIDEVDSFLQDRSKAERNWEITQVNELLTRMEAYPGVFIATTNRLEHLDSASLRRFDLKLRFDYLTVSQIRDLLGAWCARLGIAPPTDDHQGMIDSLECVTPGDFTAAARRHHFQPFAHASDVLHELAEACAMKSENSRRIGFL